MTRAESVIFAFRAFGEAGKTAARAQGANAVATTGQNLVRIGLMSDVPDDLSAGVSNT